MKSILFFCSTLLLVLVGPALAHSCSMGFSFQFKPLPEHYGEGANKLKSFLDRAYAARGWQWSDSSLSIKVPEVSEISGRIPLSAGSVSPDLAGVYERFSIFRMNRVTVVEFASEKEVAKRLPQRVDIKKMQNFGPYTGRTSKIVSGIEKIADFKISELALPFTKMRIRSMGASGIRIFAGFVPRDKKAPVQIVRAPKEIMTGPENPCSHLLYVYGAWPKNLQKSYRYE